MINKKIELEIKRIGNLKERILRLINLRENRVLEIQKEFDSKVNKIYPLISLGEERIWELRRQDLKDKEVPKELDVNLGVDWINGETTREVPIKFKKPIEKEEDKLWLYI